MYIPKKIEWTNSNNDGKKSISVVISQNVIFALFRKSKHIFIEHALPSLLGHLHSFQILTSVVCGGLFALSSVAKQSRQADLSSSSPTENCCKSAHQVESQFGTRQKSSSESTDLVVNSWRRSTSSAFTRSRNEGSSASAEASPPTSRSRNLVSWKMNDYDYVDLTLYFILIASNKNTK